MFVLSKMKSSKRMAHVNLRDLTFKNDCGPYCLQRTQALCWDYDISATTDVQAVQVLLNNALASLASICAGAQSLVEFGKYDANRTKLETLYKVSGSSLSDAQKHVQELEITKDTMDQLTSNFYKAEKGWVLLKNAYSILRRSLRSSSSKWLIKTTKR